MRRVDWVVACIVLPAVLSGCRGQSEASASPGGSTASAPPAAPAGPGTTPGAPTPVASDPAAPGVSMPASRVARIAFIGKENACQCTRAAIDASWAALQEALGGAGIPIERLTIDGQASQVGPYRELQAFFALPAIYFLDASGGLIQQLQGEVTADAIRAILFPAS